MENLPDTPVLRKRRSMARIYPSSRADAALRGRSEYYDDSLCNKCGTWAVRRVSDDACMGCDGAGPYAGKREVISVAPSRVDRKIGYGDDPTMITPEGKLILTPAKHWHKDYRGKIA